MTVRRNKSNKSGIYFISFTCYNWIPLFSLSDTWDAIYKQFDHLILKGHLLNGYVLMPNHIHILVYFHFKSGLVIQNTQTQGLINKAISTFKRFLAYDIIHNLKQTNETKLLFKLSKGVPESEHTIGKLHQVFQPSFDCKECTSESMIWEKLNYIHINPCKGKWSLAPYPSAYKHSSAYYYETGQQGYYPVTDFRLI